MTTSTNASVCFWHRTNMGIATVGFTGKSNGCTLLALGDDDAKCHETSVWPTLAAEASAMP